MNKSQDGETPEEEVTDAPGLIRQSNYQIYFVRTADSADNEATLRITQPLSVSGCMTVKQPSVEIKKIAQRMTIEIGAPIIKLDKTKQYAHYECGNAGNAIVVDITLNRDELLNDNIKIITLRNDLAADRYDVVVDEYHLQLKPKSEMVFKPWYMPQRAEPLVHWFYPENLIVLSASAKSDVTDQMRALARRRGMVDAAVMMKDFQPPSTAPNTLYMVDQTQALSNALSPSQREKIIGTVQETESFLGPDGPYDVKKDIPVRAHLPGLYE